MSRCCKKAESVFDGPNRFGLNKAEFSVQGHHRDVYFLKIRFCPFCGKGLGSRAYIEASNLRGWHVWQDGKVIATFETKGNAQAYLESL